MIGALLLAPLRPRRVADALDRPRAAALVSRHGTDTLSAFKLRDDLVTALVGRRPRDGGLSRPRRRAAARGRPGRPGRYLRAAARAAARLCPRARAALGAVGASEDVHARRARAPACATSTWVTRRSCRPARWTCPAARARACERPSTAWPATATGRADHRRRPHAGGARGARARQRLLARRRARARLQHGPPHAPRRAAARRAVLIARDGDGSDPRLPALHAGVRAKVVSLGFMRRERDTPNGLTEFMVVDAARLLGEPGIDEFSLNFVAHGRWLRDPPTRRARARGRPAARGPLVPDRAAVALQREVRAALAAAPPAVRARADLPRVAVGAIVARGQMPTPAPLRRLRSFAVTVVTGSPRPFGLGRQVELQPPATRAWAASR